MSANPYAAPAIDVDAVPESRDEAEALAIRQAHISHEASIKGIGSLWILGGCLALLGTLMQLSALTRGGNAAVVLGTMLLTGAISLGVLVTGLDMRRLRARARVGGSILAVLSLLGFPMGTLIGCYALYLLHGKKGQVVFGPDYARIVELTPQVKYKTSIIVWIALGLLVALLLAGMASAFF